jgi:ubiquinone/menaquinone biosynthesis C-methylase UbiE
MNLPFYTERATEILGLEPHPNLLGMASPKSHRDRAKLIRGSSESILLDRASVDTILVTWTLCSIPGLARALSEMHRVLEPGGQLLLVEHDLTPDEKVRTWQHRLTPSGSDSRVHAISIAQLQTWSRVPGFGSSTFRQATWKDQSR